MKFTEQLSRKEHLEAIINAMSDMVRVVSREGRVELTNDAYDHKIAGGKNIIGQHCYEDFGEREQCEVCIVREVMQTGKPQSSMRKHGNRVFSVLASPLTDENGERIAAVEVFRDMTLDYNIKQNLLSQNAKLQKDLQLARSMQQAMVKNVLPSLEGYELQAGFFPCEAVGGDIYDCIDMGGKLILYVADVSGHGVMPAMLAVFFSRSVRTACSLGAVKPSDILEYVQREFMKLHLSDTIYITSFVVVLDQKTGAFKYANAGLSVVPIVYEGNTGNVRELYMSAPPISRWFETNEFKDAQDNLNVGDRLLIYSDGIYNLQSDDSVRNRLYDFFAAENFSSDQFIANVRRELHTRPEDDLTLLLCQRQK